MSVELSVRGLTVEYHGGGSTVRPLDGLDFQAAGGTTLLLLGPSGCGKTTLLSCLAGILSPAAGTIDFDGTTISSLTGTALVEHRRHRVGIVFQAFNLIASLTALENVMTPLLAARVKPKAARTRARELLEQVGLADRTDHRPSDLSGGQQQRVAIARALVNDPPLLLADEPTAHLDQIQVDSVRALLGTLAIPSRVMVVATHDPRLLPLSPDRLDLGVTR